LPKVSQQNEAKKVKLHVNMKEMHKFYAKRKIIFFHPYRGTIIRVDTMKGIA
jgi:hypothetical protein